MDRQIDKYMQIVDRNIDRWVDDRKQVYRQMIDTQMDRYEETQIDR